MYSHDANKWHTTIAHPMAAGDIYDLNRAFERVARARAHRYTYLRTAASGLLRLPSVPLFEYFIYIYMYIVLPALYVYMYTYVPLHHTMII